MSLMRFVYTLAWWLALPLVFTRLWWRGRKEPGYRQHLAERLGFYRGAAMNTIWIHAVSVGETRAAEPLVQALLTAYPQHTILLTHMTPAGRETGHALFSKYASRVVQCYVPYDIGYFVDHFIRHFKPQLCVLIETEVWPNMMARCVTHKVPVVLANARLSERSLRKAQRLAKLGLLDGMMQGLSCVAAQTEADAQRFRLLGLRNVGVTGNIKFDVTPPDAMLAKGKAWRAQFGSRPVLLCASTRQGERESEEELILDALSQLPETGSMLVILVPRHPQRFDDVARMIENRGFAMQRRSAMNDGDKPDKPLPDNIRVLLGDSMGEMFAYYAACDVAYIGGSLLPLGGQNLIEACAVGKPVLLGPHTFNFSSASDAAVAAGAALRIADADDLLKEAMRLLQNDEKRNVMGAHAQAFTQQHRGATARTVTLLREIKQSVFARSLPP